MAILKAEDELICDFAEVYKIYDYRALPCKTAVSFFYGLSHNSRAKMKLSNSKYPLETLLLAGCLDYLKLLFWSKTEDAQTNSNRPQSILETLIGKQDKMERFDTAEDFEAERMKYFAKE